jgi:hypothetical protein
MKQYIYISKGCLIKTYIVTVYITFYKSNEKPISVTHGHRTWMLYISKGSLIESHMATVYRMFYISKGNLYESHMATVYETLYIS